MTDTKLPAFSATGACIKCNALGALKTYMACAFQNNAEHHDVIQRICNGCGYTWLETPINALPAAANAPVQP